MKIIKNIEEEFKSLNFSNEALSLGLVFGVMFWLTLDSIILGISLGFIFMIAFSEEEAKGTKNKE